MKSSTKNLKNLSVEERKILRALLEEKQKRELKDSSNVKSVRRFIEKYLWIRDKNSQLIKLKLNYAQDYIMSKIEECWEKGKPIRFVILKARQEGVSTLMQAVIFALTINNKYTKSKVISYDEDSAINLYQMSERFYRHLPDNMQPQTKYYTKKSLVFQDKENEKENLDSEILVDTGKNINTGRSETVNNWHVSEVALIERAKQLMKSAKNSTPESSNSIIVLESTARGAGDYFHQTWEDAKNKRNDYIPIFIPWFWHNEYRREVPEDFELTDYEHDIYGNEQELKEAYDLDLKQLAWRRHCIRNDCDGDLDTFKQEYPSNDIEAFIASGRTRFQKRALERLIRNTEKPKAIGEVICLEDIKEVEKHYGGTKPEMYFQEDANGNLKVWEFPNENFSEEKLAKGEKEQYAIGVDVSEGIEIDEGDKRKVDYSVIHVYKRVPFEMVAEWHGLVEPDELANIVYNIGYFYNFCWVGVERNNHGIMTNKILQDRYGMLFYKVIMDEKSEKETKKFGWITDKITKPLMIDDLASIVRQGKIKIPSKEAVNECKSYMTHPDGKTSARSGTWDDRVMASAVAYQVHKLMPMIDYNFKPIYKKPRSSVTGY